MQSLSSFRKPNSNFTMGMELECFVDTEGPTPETYKHYGFWYTTTDGSIIPPFWYQKCVEFVSQPLPKEWLKKEINKLAKKFSWETNHSCGIHIHVSRKWLSVERAKLIYSFYQSLETVEREDLFGRDSNEYCRIDEQIGLTRYCAINTLNASTIEFRMFASGDAQWAKYCVDMVDYMIRNAKHLNVSAIYAASEMFKAQYKL